MKKALKIITALCLAFFAVILLIPMPKQDKNAYMKYL